MPFVPYSILNHNTAILHMKYIKRYHYYCRIIILIILFVEIIILILIIITFFINTVHAVPACLPATVNSFINVDSAFLSRVFSYVLCFEIYFLEMPEMKCQMTALKEDIDRLDREKEQVSD
jgi:hypothetical protein